MLGHNGRHLCPRHWSGESYAVAVWGKKTVVDDDRPDNRQARLRTRGQHKSVEHVPDALSACHLPYEEKTHRIVRSGCVRRGMRPEQLCIVAVG